MWVRDHSRSLKLAPFESLGAVSYSPSIVTMAVSVAVCEIFNVKEWHDLENQVRGQHGDSKDSSSEVYDSKYRYCIIHMRSSNLCINTWHGDKWLELSKISY